MANVKISELPAASAAVAANEFEINEAGTSKKVTGTQVAAFVEGVVSSSPSFTGVVSLADGSAGAPSLTNTGDTNTGLLFPSADTVGVSVGGTQRLTVSATGAVVNGDITGSTLNATGDTAAGDNAAIGYTAAEGLILTGQGGTSDITLKNDADATVFTVPTGTDDILFPDSAKAMFGAGSDLQIFHNGTDSVIQEAVNNRRFLIGGDEIAVRTGDLSEDMAKFTANGAAELYHNNVKKIETTATGVAITGGVAVGGTGTANTLDDYEEGSFNLTMVGSSGNPSATQLLGGQYVKIGKLVSFRCFGTLNNTGAGGQLAFTGLPFTPTGVCIVNIECNSQGTFTLSPYGYISGTIIYIQQMRSNTTYIAINHNIASSGEWSITGCFHTNS